MAQVKVYGLAKHINDKRVEVSDAIHSAVMTALEYPADKKFHRCFYLDDENFIYPDDRTACYTIIEFSIFEGRSKRAKRLAYYRGVLPTWRHRQALVRRTWKSPYLKHRNRIGGYAENPVMNLSLDYKVHV